jgi:hypothetical protein
MNNAPYKGVANNLAQYGRYGDSMLVHMNPVEVQGLASLSPTGKLTLNPVTGQPEAFLPFLAPILGSFLGQAALGSTLAGALGSTALGGAAAGALGSAAATTAVTGDLEQGLLSGITGFALGSALSNLPGAGAAGEAAQAAQGITAEGIAPDLLASPTAVADAASTSAVNPAIAREFGGTFGGAELMGGAPSIGQVGATGIAPAIEAAAPQLGQASLAEPTFMQRLAQPFQDPGALLEQVTKPSVALPAYVGMGTSAQLRAQQEAEEDFRKQQEEGDAKRRADLMRTQGQMAGVFNQLRRDYPGIGYAQGGEIEGYFDGGSFENQIYNALRTSPYAGIPSAEETQLSLRGTELVAPPAASYSALDVGGEGYIPGISPEFTYFRTPLPPPPAAVDPGSLPGGGDIVGGGYFDPNFDLSALIGAGRGYQNYMDLFGGGAGQPVMQQDSVDFIDRSMGRDMLAGFDPAQIDTALYERLMEQAATPVNLEQFQTPVEQPAIPDLSMEDLITMRNMRFNAIPFQEGGMVPEPGEMMEEMAPVDEMGAMQGEYEQLINMTIAAIRGEVEDPQAVIRAFVEEFGNDAFMQLREAVLQEVVPGAQTEGMVEGMGGGQDDMVPGMIGTQRPVAVSPGEYIIPADAVALAGGGYSGDGAKFFDGLVDDIRQRTMGTTEQVRPYQGRGM